MTAIYWPNFPTFTYPSPIWRPRWEGFPQAIGFICGMGKLEWLRYNLVKVAWRSTQSLGHNTSTRQIERQTDTSPKQTPGQRTASGDKKTAARINRRHVCGAQRLGSKEDTGPDFLLVIRRGLRQRTWITSSFSCALYTTWWVINGCGVRTMMIYQYHLRHSLPLSPDQCSLRYSVITTVDH